MPEDKLAFLDKAVEALHERKKQYQEAMDGKPQEPAPAPVKSPEEEYAAYFAKWFQQLAPFRTNCFRCGVDSPIVHNRVGTLAWGDTKQIRRGDTDITNDVITAFERIGWKFQKRRSYCPTCKKLGSI
jgi:hypothetical protein